MPHRRSLHLIDSLFPSRYDSVMRVGTFTILTCSIFLLVGCQNNIFQPQADAPRAMKDVPAVRLNFRYEPDVPQPAAGANKASGEERNAAVQSDFDVARPQELLDRVLSSPDKKHVLAIYHRVTDIQSEFRLDMYSPDGKLLRKLTSRWCSLATETETGF